MSGRVTAHFVVMGSVALLATAAAGGFEMAPAVQAELDKQKGVVAAWAANPVIVNAVLEQNRRGPIAGMDNARWKITRRTDPVVIGLQSNPAGRLLKARLAESAAWHALGFSSLAATSLLSGLPFRAQKVLSSHCCQSSVQHRP